MTPEERAYTKTSVQIRFRADANTTPPIATSGWVDTRQEVSVTPEERAMALKRRFSEIMGAKGYDFENVDVTREEFLAEAIEAFRAAIAEAREEEVRNHRERLREWLAEHGVQSVKGESMLETGWRAARAMERQACLLDVWEGDADAAAIEARIRARDQA